MRKSIAILFTIVLFSCCQAENEIRPEDPKPDINVVPVVVHVLHKGEVLGEGTNISDERILRQIEILNEDFSREEGTRGFNEHTDGGDAETEFILAKQDPEGKVTSGIVRRELVIADVPDDIPKFEFEQYAFFSYWSSENYINIWVVPYPLDLANILLGKATGPDTDLQGNDLFQKPISGGAEGVIINWAHFGESDLEGGHHLGRTLTHEMGHYLGLLHTWGNKECDTNDYCDDTPAVDDVVKSSQSYLGCQGDAVMVENYMNYTPDAVMNTFTRDQIERMRYVLNNSPRRASLLLSPGKKEP